MPRTESMRWGITTIGKGPFRNLDQDRLARSHRCQRRRIHRRNAAGVLLSRMARITATAGNTVISRVTEGDMMQNVAIVTGHSSGLGQAFASRLLSSGFLVVGVSRRPTGGSTAADRLRVVQGSVADQSTVDLAFEAAHSLGQLRMVVNCAGCGVFGEVGSYSVAEVKSVVDSNLVGLIAFSDRAVRSMREEGGDIVNVMSTASKKLRTAESVYTAAKWGAKAYTRTIRDAVKAAKLPIRVFEVYPCGMKTRFWSDAVRPPSDGSAFPLPGPIAESVLTAILAQKDSYQQEFTFERR